METPIAPSPPTSQVASRRNRGTLYHLEVVIAVAFIIATLFTAWTPASLRNSNTTQGVGGNSAVQPPLQPQSQLAEGVTPTPRARPLVGLVAGHWGNDSGSVCSDGLQETQVNQNIASLVQKYLVAKGLDVEVLHEFDPMLQGYQASVLVSIHADSCDFINNQATGFKVAAAMANPHPERAARLTACLRSRYGQITALPLHSTSVTSDMTSYHAFGEIDENTTSAIIETGFLNLDRQVLTQHADLAAKGIAEGILCYIHNEDISIQATAQPTTTTAQPTTSTTNTTTSTTQPTP
jgi:N-acetylmuramoyl-L-alanine amidase